MKMFIFACAAGVAAAGLAPASAQQQVQAQARTDATARPGKTVTRTEVSERVRTMFARLDADRDGFVTRQEATSARGRRGKAASVDPQRAADRRARAFERFDTNRDGSISRAEWDAAAAKRGEGHGKGITGWGGHRGGIGMIGASIRGRMFDVADANRDARLSLEEATTAALVRFDRLDLDRNGTLSPEEKAQARQRPPAQREPG